MRMRIPLSTFIPTACGGTQCTHQVSLENVLSFVFVHIQFPVATDVRVFGASPRSSDEHRYSNIGVNAARLLSVSRGLSSKTFAFAKCSHFDSEELNK